VRVVPFNTGSGTVPAIGTSISQGGVSGPLLGVWANWQSEPLAAGAAMPATGYIKLRSVAGGAFAAGALTGITASATGPDVVGWIEVRGADTAQITVPRIGRFETVGGWFELGTTSGARGQILACPTSATVAGTFVACWIETAAGSGVFERWHGMGSAPALATLPTDNVRGRIFWHTTSGLRIGSDGTNNVGYLPPAGCRVRIPNIILTCCTRTVSGSGPRVLPNATMATRQEFVTSAAGDVSLDHANVQWYCNFAQAYALSVTNSVVSDTLIPQEIATAFTITESIIAPTQAQVQIPLNIAACFAGATISNVDPVRYNGSGNCSVVTTSLDLAFTDVISKVCVDRTGAGSYQWLVSYCKDCTWDECGAIGNRADWQSTINSRITNFHYADRIAGTTTSGLGALTAVTFSNFDTDSVLDGLDFFGLTNVHPYSYLVGVSYAQNTRVRNIGTDVAPLSLGSANQTGQAWGISFPTTNVKFQRCHVSNTRTGAAQKDNAHKGLTFENCSFDYADALFLVGINEKIRGCKGGYTSTAQTSVYGSHWLDYFNSATTGRITWSGNEPTAETAAQVTVVAGAPVFNALGSIAMVGASDWIETEMPYFALGHTALGNVAPTYQTNNDANFTFEFQYDKGAGYNGVWLPINAANLSGAGAIDPAVGIRLKLRIRVAVAAAANIVSYISIPTVTTSTAQNTLYPLETFAVTFNGLPTGTDAVVLDAGTSTVLAQADALPGTSYTYEYSGAQTVDVGFIKTGYVPFYIRNLSLTEANSSIPVALTADRNFS
jgi:hypothetical protein